MKRPVVGVTEGEQADSAEPVAEQSLAARVLAEGIESVSGVVHGALGALETKARRASGKGEPSRTDGRSSRWAAHRAARRDELIDAAITAVTQHGASVGMDQIASVAKTSKPVIYRYFTDKTDLYRAVSQRVVGDVLTTLVRVMETDPPPRELIHASIDAYLGLLEDNPELYHFVARHPLVEQAAGASDVVDFSTVVAELLTQHLGTQLRAAGLDPAAAHPWGEAIVGFISAASIWWIDHRDAMSRRQLADYLSSLLWGGAAGVYQSVGLDVDAKPAPNVFPKLPT
ncbi:MAG: TetR/AcrR family transcriptional regulator [Pseudonocardiales bacterium]